MSRRGKSDLLLLLTFRALNLADRNFGKLCCQLHFPAFTQNKYLKGDGSCLLLNILVSSIFMKSLNLDLVLTL